MKKWIATAFLITSMVTFAQQRPERPMKNERAEMEKLTPEQRNSLRLKELTLKLDLNASQQKDMAKVLTDLQAKREAAITERKAGEGKKLTADEIYSHRSKMLDEKIAMKERVKKILTPEQMDKWEKMGRHRKMEMTGKRNRKAPKAKE